MSTDHTISPFRIDTPAEVLDDLRRRLHATRWPEAEPVDDWSQGIPLAYLQDVCAYWADGYDWPARAERLNAFPQFTTEIDGVDIHFLHVRSPHDHALPLVITHGWPGSIAEFEEVIGPLTDPTAHGGSADDAFHVVCPSLPGYGFSGKPSETGWGVEHIADAWGVLMDRLGYDRFLAQGGDWGSMVTTCIGMRNPDHCMGIHLNMPLALPDPDTMDSLTEAEMGAIGAFDHYQKQESGYSKQQSTRPQTLGYGLVDSPAGQAAWILEKFHAWTDNDGTPDERGRSGPAPRQRDVVLAARHGGVERPSVLGELQLAAVRRDAGSRRLQHLPQGDLPHLEALGREAVRGTAPLQRARPGRPLRRHGGTRPLRHRGARLLPLAALSRRRPVLGRDVRR